MNSTPVMGTRNFPNNHFNHWLHVNSKILFQTTISYQLNLYSGVGMMITVRVTCRRGLEVLTASSVTLNEFFMKFWNLSNLLGGFFNWKQRRNRINTYWVRFFVMSGSNWKRDESYKKVLFVLLLFVRNRVWDKIYRQEGIGSERRVWHLQGPLASTHCCPTS